MKNLSLKLTSTCLFAAMVIINMLANIIPLGIGTTGDVSEQYPSLFTPAPITFAIWGLIYLLLIFYVLYQWGLLGMHEDSYLDLISIGSLFAVSCVLNICWIFAWHFDVIWLSTIFIVSLLVVLAIISKRIKRDNRLPLSYLMVNIGFDIYFGWIIAATIANISVLLVSLDWNGFGVSPIVWTCAILIVGAIIGSCPVLVDRKWFSTLAVIWAYVGILIKHISKSGFAGEYPSIILATVIGIILMLTAMAIRMVRGSCCHKNYCYINDDDDF